MGDFDLKQGSFDSEAISRQVDLNSDSLPPVNDWHPELSGDIDIFINRRGEWFHEGGRFEREALVKLFASILRCEGKEYFLVTPVEKWRLRVEDAPFVITQMELQGDGDGQRLVFETNLGERFEVDGQHPLWVEQDAQGEELTPYVRVRDELNALLSRPVYYQLAELAQEADIDGKNHIGVYSHGQFYSLMTDGAEG
ncbi:DUF1285 domain-containing protein [Motiliproteus coralliicola]|uniref:DUF1285 domain-containing protein n=1 Tax=Motiliproteus coralliicola TaxID=2283196 RepID=A0A369WT09_9GAMM|nr:DUF1285 domain-containing protein [Motiliproteus coralliicola]RDE24711.1 DUF1285 domain-containing protein [Motiliproteus coralliicola]